MANQIYHTPNYDDLICRMRTHSEDKKMLIQRQDNIATDMPSSRQWGLSNFYE